MSDFYKAIESCTWRHYRTGRGVQLFVDGLLYAASIHPTIPNQWLTSTQCSKDVSMTSMKGPLADELTRLYCEHIQKYGKPIPIMSLSHTESYDRAMKGI